MDTIDWSQITGKPAVFPPEVHTHSPDDLVGAGTKPIDLESGNGQGLKVGKARFDSTGPSTIPVTTGGAAQTIFVAPGGTPCLRLTIVGDDGTNVFCDDVAVSFLGGGGFAEFAKKDVLGTPRARTYSFAAQFKMALGGAPGVTYNVRAAVQAFPA